MMNKKFLVLIALLSISASSAIAKDKLPKDFEEQVLNIIRNNPEVIEETMKTYVEEKNRIAQEENLKQRLANRVKIDIGSSPQFGNKDAKYKLFIFTDFECQYCSQGEVRIRELQRKYDLLVIYKNNPLPFHKNAKSAAKAALAAHKQNKFTEYKDLLFVNQGKFSDELYIQLAKDTGLDMDKFKADLASEDIEKQINDDLKIAAELSITGTPTFFVNGVKIEGALPVAEFDRVMQRL